MGEKYNIGEKYVNTSPTIEILPEYSVESLLAIAAEMEARGEFVIDQPGKNIKDLITSINDLKKTVDNSDKTEADRVESINMFIRLLRGMIQNNDDFRNKLGEAISKEMIKRMPKQTKTKKIIITKQSG